MKWFKRIQKPLTVGTEPEGVLDTASPTWRYVEQWANDQLDDIRKKNDSIKNSPDVTAMYRGQIKQCKRLLEISKEPANGS